MSKISLSVSALCVLAGACAAQSQPAASPPTGPSAEQVVAARQASMVLSGVTLGSLRKAAEDGADVKTEAYIAGGLGRWAKALPSMFPAGTAPEAMFARNHARPDIWADRPGFGKASDDFVAATTKLRELATAGDAAAFKVQLDEVQKACDGCHAAYKSKP